MFHALTRWKWFPLLILITGFFCGPIFICLSNPLDSKKENLSQLEQMERTRVAIEAGFNLSVFNLTVETTVKDKGEAALNKLLNQTKKEVLLLSFFRGLGCGILLAFPMLAFFVAVLRDSPKTLAPANRLPLSGEG